MHIRPATAADAFALASLRYDFRAAMNPPEEPREHFVARASRWMAERLQPGRPWYCWLAEEEGSAIGQLWLQIIEKVPNPGPELEAHAYITNVYVAQHARDRGIGTGLVEAALTFCQENGVDSAVLWPTERSRALYARYGFEPPADMLELVLDHGRDVH